MLTMFPCAVQDQEDGPLHEFYNKIQDEGGEFMQQITKLRDLTLFAPSNLAWTTANIVNVHNRDKLREILNLHLVYERLTVEKIRDENVNQVCLEYMTFLVHPFGYNIFCEVFLYFCCYTDRQTDLPTYLFSDFNKCLIFCICISNCF